MKPPIRFVPVYTDRGIGGKIGGRGSRHNQTRRIEC